MIAVRVVNAANSSCDIVMFAKYKISVQELLLFIGGDTHLTSYLKDVNFQNWEREQYAAYRGNCLHPVIFGKNGVIEAQVLGNEQFPIQKRHVFISHSSKDADIAKVFAYILSLLGIECFIDSMIWNNISDLQRELDERYCWLHRGTTFNYKKRNNSTAHVHTMLLTALFEMIDICECCVFIESDNSLIRLDDINDTNKKSTFSPWIFSEINYIDKIRIQLPERHRTRLYSEGGALNESYKLKIVYPMDYIDSMITLTNKNFQNLCLYKRMSEYTSGEDLLDILYRVTGIINKEY